MWENVVQTRQTTRVNIMLRGKDAVYTLDK